MAGKCRGQLGSTANTVIGRTLDRGPVRLWLWPSSWGVVPYKPARSPTRLKSPGSMKGMGRCSGDAHHRCPQETRAHVRPIGSEISAGREARLVLWSLGTGPMQRKSGCREQTGGNPWGPTKQRLGTGVRDRRKASRGWDEDLTLGDTFPARTSLPPRWGESIRESSWPHYHG